MTRTHRSGATATLMTAALMLGLPLVARAASESATLFSTKCSSCHTYGRGDLVGPDLKGVTSRRPRTWLLGWIRSSERMIKSGNGVAQALFQQYRKQRMPDQPLSETQITALLDYLAANGPETDRAKAPRLAVTSTPQDVERGRDLFFGRQAMNNGGVACASCHSIQDQPALAGGSLAPDLTRAYAKYQDKALASLLEQACFPRMPAAGGERPVTDDESFLLRAFLRGAYAQQQLPPRRTAIVSEGASRNGR